MGEVDIVCGKGAELCFVEVKTRKNTSMGYPAEAVNSNKLRHIKNVAEYYVQNKKIKGKFISFKVVEIIAGVISDIV